MDRGIFWGSSPDMTKSEINYVIKVVKKIFNESIFLQIILIC